jgi:protein-disulfide isomerase
MLSIVFFKLILNTYIKNQVKDCKSLSCPLAKKQKKKERRKKKKENKKRRRMEYVIFFLFGHFPKGKIMT